MDKKEFVELCASHGHRKRSAANAIREKCLDCVCGNAAEVRRCVMTDCALWPFRFGKSPYHGDKKNGNTEIQSEKG